MSLFRDFFIKKKGTKKFPLHYVLIAGIAGVVPDFDIGLFWIVSFFGFTIDQIHRTFLHTIYVPLVFLVLGLIFYIFNKNIAELGRHRLKLSIVCYMIALGGFIHLVLDAIFVGKIIPFYGFSNFSIGLNLFGYLPSSLEMIAAASLDGVLLIIWLIYLELKHKISDFI